MYSCPQQLNSCHIKKLCKDLNIVLQSGRQLINFYGKLLLLDSASLEGSKINLEIQSTMQIMEIYFKLSHSASLQEFSFLSAHL